MWSKMFLWQTNMATRVNLISFMVGQFAIMWNANATLSQSNLILLPNSRYIDEKCFGTSHFLMSRKFLLWMAFADPEVCSSQTLPTLHERPPLALSALMVLNWMRWKHLPVVIAFDAISSSFSVWRSSEAITISVCSLCGAWCCRWFSR